MKKFWEQLKPQERRWLIIIGCVVFVTMNYFFVWPQFAEWKKNTNRMNADTQNMAKYQAELAHNAEYERKIHGIDPEDQNIAQEDQALHFEQGFRDKAVENGVQIQSTSRPLTRPDEFTIEQRETIQVLTGERNLVDYLYSLGSSGSAMRVESMSLRPLDLNRYQLRADLTIVESYLKNPSPTARARYTAAAAPGTLAENPAPRTANSLPPTNRPGPIKH